MEEVTPIATAAAVDPDLVIALICQESRGDPWTNRFEPGWRYFVSPRDWASRLCLSADTETTLQSMSWGLMQIMGSVARELGHTTVLGRLLDPKVNITLGCKKLRSLMTRFPEESDWISAYNAGSPRRTLGGMYLNQSNYVDPVCGYLRELRAIVG